MKYLSFFLLSTLISCSSGLQRKDIDAGPYQSSGVEQFFLPELPQWANFSQSGQCFRKTNIAYMDFSKLFASYQLTYPQMIELQAQYNDRLENYFRSAAIRFLKPVEQASFFSNTLEQVRAGVKAFKLPSVKEVEIVWLEGSTPEDIVKLSQNGHFNKTLPILFSSCHTHQTLKQWVSENGLSDVGFYLLSAEWLLPYDAKQSPAPGPLLFINDFFGSTVKVKFLSTKNIKTTELVFP